MKTKLPAAIIAIAFAFTGCAAFQQFAAQHSALILSAGQLARVALVATATAYGGPLAGAAVGAAASAGLDSIAVYVQGQVGKKLNPAIVAQMPGIPAVGNAVVAAIDPTKVVTQADANTAFAAAKMAASSGTP